LLDWPRRTGGSPSILNADRHVMSLAGCVLEVYGAVAQGERTYDPKRSQSPL